MTHLSLVNLLTRMACTGLKFAGLDGMLNLAPCVSSVVLSHTLHQRHGRVVRLIV